MHRIEGDLKSLKTYDLYVSSLTQGEIYKISFYGRGALLIYLSGLTTPSDFCYDRKKDEIVIPSTKRGTISTVFKDNLV